MKKIKPAPRKPITKLKKPYEGGDALMDWHREKLQSTMRDVEYATPMWRCETDWDRAKDYLVWGVVWAILLGCLYLVSAAFNLAV
jgi:hypothetical protein